jgi:hypothetical protein
MICALAFVASFGSPLLAQRPTAAECGAAVAALAVPNRDMSGWERVAECGVQAGQALGTALTNARTETDGKYLSNLWTAAAAIRDPSVLNSAIALARDRSATVPARVVALVVALAQHVRGVGITGWPLDRLTTEPWGPRCAFAVTTHQLPGSQNPVPTTYVRRLAALYDEVGWAADENPVLADIARCARVVLRNDVPESVDPSRITLTYMCGTKYRVTNTAPKGATVTYRVSHTREAGDLTIPPKGSRDFYTVFIDAVRLEYNGRVIQEAENGGRECAR